MVRFSLVALLARRQDALFVKVGIDFSALLRNAVVVHGHYEIGLLGFVADLALVDTARILKGRLSLLAKFPVRFFSRRNTGFDVAAFHLLSVPLGAQVDRDSVVGADVARVLGDGVTTRGRERVLKALAIGAVL